MREIKFRAWLPEYKKNGISLLMEFMARIFYV